MALLTVEGGNGYMVKADKYWPIEHIFTPAHSP